MFFRQAPVLSAMSVQPSCSGRCLSVVGGRRGGLTSQAASVRSRLASSNSGGLRSVCPPACSSMRGISRSPLDHRSLGLRGCNHSRKAGACILFDVHQLSYVRPSRVPFTGAGEPVYDLVLSSGFLAFANHSGFLAAVEEAGLQVGGIMGTSAGALAGSLYCAGYTPSQVAEELSRDTPIQLLSPSLRGGLLSLDPVVERLRQLLPPRFEDLEREFAVGVVDAQGRHVIIDNGPLPEAVAASAAIPIVFENVNIPGYGPQNPFKDGGVVDRIGLKAWRDRRREQLSSCSGRRTKDQPRIPHCLVHVIHRSTPLSGNDDVTASGESNVTVVNSPKSGVSLFSLGDFKMDMAKAAKRAKPQLDLLRQGNATKAKPSERKRMAGV